MNELIASYVRAFLVVFGTMFSLLSAVASEEPKRFLWAELIAFDNTREDFGVEEYLARMKFKPEAISLLLIEAEVFERHQGVNPQQMLPERACAYCARPYNKEHARQDWTCGQLKGLVTEINRHGIETYASFFEWGRQNLVGLTKKGDEPYCDFFIRQTVAFLRDYGFTGLHAADGFAHPRKMLTERGLAMTDRFAEAEKWGAFWKKASKAFRDAGFKTYLNTCWKKDPYEAVVRYGYDYRLVSESDIDGWVVESTAAVEELEGWNNSPVRSQDKTTAMLVRLGPALREKEAVLLFGIKDDLEQYHALYHAPTGTEAEAMCKGSVFFGKKRVLSGFMACLSDAITPGEWERIDKMWRAGLAAEPAEPLGFRVVWSDAAFDRELKEAPERRIASTKTLVSMLINRGSVICSSVSVEEALADERMPILVIHPGFFDPQDLAALQKRGRKCVTFGYGRDDFTEFHVKEDPKSWMDELRELTPCSTDFVRAHREMLALTPVVPEDHFEDIVLSGFKAKDGAWYVVARNNRKIYANAQLWVKDSVGKIGILSDYPSVPAMHLIQAKIPPSGAVMLRLDNVVGK